MILIIYNRNLPCAETGKQIETEREFLLLDIINHHLFELVLHSKRVCQGWRTRIPQLSTEYYILVCQCITQSNSSKATCPFPQIFSCNYAYFSTEWCWYLQSAVWHHKALQVIKAGGESSPKAPPGSIAKAFLNRWWCSSKKLIARKPQSCNNILLIPKLSLRISVMA